MVRHNNVIPGQHFHKNWARRVKTWLHQPAQKKIRRDRRKEKAALIAPRPSSGQIRPLVHCPTQKYNAKIKLGRGFTLGELKEAGIGRQYAKTVGISVDHRRTNKSVGTMQTNIERLKEYKARLVIFPKKQDAVKAVAAYPSTNSNELTIKPKVSKDAISYAVVTDEMKAFRAYDSLRRARSDCKLVGIRLKKAKEGKEGGAKPEAAAAAKGGDEE